MICLLLTVNVSGPFKPFVGGRGTTILSSLAWSLAGAVLLTSIPGQALDFTLHNTTMQEDGLETERTYFLRDPSTPTNIDVPRGWDITSDEHSIIAMPRAISGSQLTVEKSRFAPDTPFKDRGLETYRRYVFSMVPQGAVNVQIATQKEGALNLFEWKDFEFVLTYDLFGQALKRSTIFVNLNTKEQVIVTSVASASNFDAVHSAAVDAMRSWYPLKTKPR